MTVFCNRLVFVWSDKIRARDVIHIRYSLLVNLFSRHTIRQAVVDRLVL